MSTRLLLFYCFSLLFGLSFYLFGINLFNGDHFCYLPVEDKGPGTIGCFYSAGNVEQIK